MLICSGSEFRFLNKYIRNHIGNLNSKSKSNTIYLSICIGMSGWRILRIRRMKFGEIRTLSNQYQLLLFILLTQNVDKSYNNGTSSEYLAINTHFKYRNQVEYQRDSAFGCCCRNQDQTLIFCVGCNLIFFCLIVHLTTTTEYPFGTSIVIYPLQHYRNATRLDRQSMAKRTISFGH